MDLRLAEFQYRHAATVLGWPSDAEEMEAWAGSAAPFPATAALFQLWHADPDVHPLLLLAGEEETGYGEIWVDDEEREIELARMIVAPCYRGQGHGQALVRLLLGRAADFRLPNVFVRVVRDNRSAIRCYERAGITRVSTVDEQRYNRGQPRSYVWMRHEGENLRMRVAEINRSAN